jgi:hypothetical protein
MFTHFSRLSSRSFISLSTYKTMKVNLNTTPSKKETVLHNYVTNGGYTYYVMKRKFKQ